MSITRQKPNTVHLGGHVEVINDVPAGVAITPGYLIERYKATTMKFRPHATSAGLGAKTVALNQPYLNLGIDTAYAIGDLVDAAIASPGASFYMLIASGQNLALGDMLESAGDGTLNKYGSGVRLFQALEDANNTAGPGAMRIRVEAL